MARPRGALLALTAQLGRGIAVRARQGHLVVEVAATDAGAAGRVEVEQVATDRTLAGDVLVAAGPAVEAEAPGVREHLVGHAPEPRLEADHDVRLARVGDRIGSCVRAAAQLA